MTQNLTAAQRVWGIAELRENIYLQMDPKTLFNNLDGHNTAKEVYASKALRRKLYFEQLPELPYTVPAGNEAYEFTKWEPNRVLLPDNRSEFVFRTEILDDMCVTLKTFTRGTFANDGRPTNPTQLFNHTYRILHVTIEPYRTDYRPPRMLTEGFAKMMLTDRATEFRIEFRDPEKNSGNVFQREPWYKTAGPGTTVGDLARWAEEHCELLRVQEADLSPQQRLRQLENERGLEVFREYQREYRARCQQSTNERASLSCNGVPSIFGQSAEWYEKFFATGWDVSKMNTSAS
ncbi:hypothetical protein M409DRAFT_22281 [Zasmidium cellare ATCC 36951]|uniref:Uncharacterized protein n=1 Tax=Zasmidium cellare ATCC 36951 TaxID=1080233 RepID=A0A6A6CJR9_ZASCE|nr:uncharacterized protein M409DRAFT_22281 [Zasmidium cellare ATCC 36951]KAF2167474.1 hypothetical protein M409DRAFT_22281 [Zasmidium cellare ATCC 36951]